MSLTLLLGGARSGKSALAVRLAEGSGRPVWVVATAEARDPEMAARIARHRRERPSGWETLEEPRDLEGALGRVPADACLLLDCLTLWVSNLMEAGEEAEGILHRAGEAAGRAARRAGPTIAVSNEVGSGIVPANRTARAYRDLLGAVNALWADAATEALLVVAGRVLPLERPDA